jgi:MFS family permease
MCLIAYQSTIYQSLGYSAFMAGIFGSIWSVLNGTGNFCGGMLGDYVGRKKLVGKSPKLDRVYIVLTLTLLAVSLVILDCMLIVLCTTTYLYSGTDNKAGNTAAAVFTFLMIIV